MHIHPSSTLPGYSALAAAIARNDATLLSLFSQARHGPPLIERRPDAVRAIRESMKSLTLSSQQSQALERFAEGAACIVTGQQAGFLGGPLYTVAKAASVLSRVRHHEAAGMSAAGVFWIEDNDHDLDEAARATLIHREHGTVTITARDYSTTLDRQSVASCVFDERIVHLCDHLSAILSDGSATVSAADDVLREAYVPGRTWADAFLHLLNHWFSRHGLLFVKASTVRTMGLMQDVLLRDVQEPGATMADVEAATKTLTDAGYHAQITAGVFNVFHHDEQDRRHKLHVHEGGEDHVRVSERSISRQEVLALMTEQPERFSPSVVLRPLVQDHLLGSAEIVAGPGELAYLAQLTHVYGRYGVSMPDLVPRSGATFLSMRVERLLQKEQAEARHFFRTWEEIERETTSDALDIDVMEALGRAREGNGAHADDLLVRMEGFDKSLVAAVLALRKAVANELDALERKVTAAARRKQEEQLKRRREIHFFIFPDERLQERVIAPISLMRVARESAVGPIIDVIGNHPIGHHFMISESAPGTTRT
ncbi:MAG: bacillithiol biosynthesis cysteine-adding enzyme BshC [Candidatus Kapaibacterium sp.]